MNEDFGNDIIELVDEDGQTVSLEHLDTVEYQNAVYMCFIEADMNLSESYDLVILKVEEEPDGSEALVSIEDEDEMDALFQIFSERLEETFEDETPEDGPVH